MFTVNTRTDGLGAIFKLHEEIALKVLHDAGDEPMRTREIWNTTNGRLDLMDQDPKSRATYINFVQGLAGAGLIEAVPTKGKGGKRHDYRFKPGGFMRFKQVVAKRIIQSVINAFPDVDFDDVLNDLNREG